MTVIPGAHPFESAGKLFWTTSDSVPPVGRIRRADLDGTHVEDFLVNLGKPFELAIDRGGGKIYWTDPYNKKIQRAELAGGGNVESIVAEGSGRIYGLTLDISAGKIYWTDYDLAKIRRADLDGSNVEDIRTGIAAAAIEIGPDLVVPVRPGSWSGMKDLYRER
jgi:low density lipoprotein receptor-related protein 5/6